MDYFKILVVHRQEAMLEEVKLAFEKFEPSLQWFSCGIDGLQASKLEHFDLILCGTDLPLITGFEMVRAIRNLSRNCITPVIFISDRLVRAHEKLCMKLGAVGIVGNSNLKANLTYILENAAAFRLSQPVTI